MPRKLAGQLRQRKYALLIACFFVLSAHFAGAYAYERLEIALWGAEAGAGQIFLAIVWWRILLLALVCVCAVWPWGVLLSALGAVFLGSLNAMCWAMILKGPGFPFLGWCFCLFFSPIEIGLTAGALTLSIESGVKLLPYRKDGLANLLVITEPIPACLAR